MIRESVRESARKSLARQISSWRLEDLMFHVDLTPFFT